MRREQAVRQAVRVGVRVAAAALTGVLLTCCHAGGPSAGGPSADGSSGVAGHPTPSPTATAGPPVAPPTAGGRVIPIDGVVVQDGGLKLSTRTLGGGCRRLALQAQESPAEVRLTLTTTRPPGICPPYVTLVEVSTTLHTPLGSRHLIDTATGRPIPPPQPR